MSIEIRGVDKLLKKLGKVQTHTVLEPPMRRAVLRLQRDMQEYPPQPANSLYRRTGTLGRRWTTRITRSASGLSGRVGNNTRYAPWVQSQRFQRGIHQRTGWPTDIQVIERNRAAIVDDFKRAIDRALED